MGCRCPGSSIGILAITDEKSESFWLIESRFVVTPRLLRIFCTPSARPCEYVSWSSMT